MISTSTSIYTLPCNSPALLKTKYITHLMDDSLLEIYIKIHSTESSHQSLGSVAVCNMAWYRTSVLQNKKIY